MGTLRRRTRRTRRAVVGVVLLLDLAVLGTDGYLLTHRATTTKVGLQDALVTFRGSTSAPAPTGVVSPGGPAVTAVSPPTSGTRVAAAAPTAPVKGHSTPTTSAPPARSGGPSTTTAPQAAPPAEGVYAYRTSGGESISVLAAHHDYPAVTYAAVRRTGGCGWRIHAAVVQEHVDERTLCSDSGTISQISQTRQVTFFGTTDGGTFTCAPPAVQTAAADVVGSRSQTDCGDGKGSSAHLVRTTLARETVVVDRVPVAVVRIRIDGTITGRIRGTSTDLLTLVVGTGLPIRWQRSVDSLADAFGSTVRYQEQAQFDLISLTPQT